MTSKPRVTVTVRDGEVVAIATDGSIEPADIRILDWYELGRCRAPASGETFLMRPPRGEEWAQMLANANQRRELVA